MKVCKRCNKEIDDTYNKNRNYHHKCKEEHKEQVTKIKLEILRKKDPKAYAKVIQNEKLKRKLDNGKK